MNGWLTNWLERHRHPVSLVLHIVGIPLAVGAVVVAVVQLVQWRWDLWWRPGGLLVGGYLLQWIGHLIEGNDMGELMVVKRWLGRPYVAISPRWGDRNEPGVNGAAGPDPTDVQE